MQLTKFSLGQNKSTQEIQKYDTGKYVLKLNTSPTVLSIYALDDGQFIIHHVDYYVTARALDRKLKKVLQLNSSNDEKEQISNILISGYFYEAICRTGVPVSILINNLNIIKEFVHKFLQQWDISLPYEFTFIIPKIKENLNGTCRRRTCFLQGSNGTYEIGLSIENDIFLSNGKKTYYLLQPDILKNHQLSRTKIGAAEKALYWAMLANMYFNIGYGDSFSCTKKDFKCFIDAEEFFNDDVFDIWHPDDSKEWFGIPNHICKLLEGVTPETISLISKKLKESYS